MLSEVRIPHSNDIQVEKVTYLVKDNGDWNMERLVNIIPQNIIDKILAIHPPSTNNEDDVCWKSNFNHKRKGELGYLKFMINFKPLLIKIVFVILIE